MGGGRGSRRARGFDPIAFVESAYALDRSDAEWLEALCATLRPLVPRRLAMVGYVFEQEAHEARAVAVLDGPPEHGGVTRELCKHPRVGHAIANTRIVSAAAVLGPTFAALLTQCPPELASITAGVTDFVGLTANTDAGEVIVLGAPVRSFERTLSGRLTRSLLLHLATGARLRQRLRRGFLGEPLAEAVLDASGRVLHAEGAARRRSVLERLRAAAVSMDRARTRAQLRDPEGALELRQALVDGRWSVLDRFDSDGKRMFIAYCNPAGSDPRALTPRERAVLDLALAGNSGKQIAAALQLSPSTVSQRLASARRKLGAQGRAETLELYTTPGALDRFSFPMSSPAATPNRPPQDGQEDEAHVLSADLAPPELPPGLTPTEGALVRLLLSGMSRRNIAKVRGVSPHTVNHQISSIYKKLGVGTHRELVLSLLAGR